MNEKTKGGKNVKRLSRKKGRQILLENVEKWRACFVQSTLAGLLSSLISGPAVSVHCGIASELLRRVENTRIFHTF